MLLSTAEDLAKFVAELQAESDRGLALVGSALIDDRLCESLRALFVEGRSGEKVLDEGNAPLGTFSARVEACYVLGLIDDFERGEINLLRKVRNEFAHATHGTTFKSPKVQGFCSSLKADLPEEAGYPTNDPRFRFMNAVIVVVLRLYHRPDWVALERRQAKEYVREGNTSWRSFAQNPPAKGQHYIAIGRAKAKLAE